MSRLYNPQCRHLVARNGKYSLRTSQGIIHLGEHLLISLQPHTLGQVTSSSS